MGESPMLSAAILLSLIAMIARPVLELTRFWIITRMISRRITAAVNVEIFLIPTAPMGPLIITFPVALIARAAGLLNAK